MPIPTFDQFIEPILRYLASHPEGALARDVHEAAADSLGLTDADRAILLPSGVQAVYKNRAGWAHDLLKRAGFSANSSPEKLTLTVKLLLTRRAEFGYNICEGYGGTLSGQEKRSKGMGL